MALSIRNRKVEALARRVARATGESLTDAIMHALEDRQARLQGRSTQSQRVDQILEIGRRCASLPDRDARSTDEILGYRPDGTVD